MRVCTVMRCQRLALDRPQNKVAVCALMTPAHERTHPTGAMAMLPCVCTGVAVYEAGAAPPQPPNPFSTPSNLRLWGPAVLPLQAGFFKRLADARVWMGYFVSTHDE